MTGAYTYLAEFDSSKDAYTYAAEVHNRFEFKDFSIILVDVVREREMAPGKAVRFVFTPGGFVINADELTRSKNGKRRI